MDVQKLMDLLMIAGAIAVGLPAMLHGIRMGLQSAIVFFKMIPGKFPENVIEKLEAGIAKVEAGSEKVADFIKKIFPKAADGPKLEIKPE